MLFLNIFLDFISPQAHVHPPEALDLNSSLLFCLLVFSHIQLSSCLSV